MEHINNKYIYNNNLILSFEVILPENFIEYSYKPEGDNLLRKNIISNILHFFKKNEENYEKLFLMNIMNLFLNLNQKEKWLDILTLMVKLQELLLQLESLVILILLLKQFYIVKKFMFMIVPPPPHGGGMGGALELICKLGNFTEAIKYAKVNLGSLNFL
jgi:hypothetical protein